MEYVLGGVGAHLHERGGPQEGQRTPPGQWEKPGNADPTDPRLSGP